MSKARSRRPASDRRPTRRSLVELTAAASHAVDDGLLVTPASPFATAPDDSPRSEHAAKMPDRAAVAGQATAPIPVVVPEAANAAASRGGEAVDADSSVEMMVKIAKDCQNRALEDFRVNLNAALDYAKGFAEARAGSEEASKSHGGTAVEDSFLTALGGAAAEFRAEALASMKANLVTTLEYARELAGARTAAEIAELSGTQARKQCELFLKQTDALKSIAQLVPKSGAE